MQKKGDKSLVCYIPYIVHAASLHVAPHEAVAYDYLCDAMWARSSRTYNIFELEARALNHYRIIAVSALRRCVASNQTNGFKHAIELRCKPRMMCRLQSGC